MSDLVIYASTKTSDYSSGTSETSSEAGRDIATRLTTVPSTYLDRNVTKVIRRSKWKQDPCSTKTEKQNCSNTIYQCQLCPYASRFPSHYQKHSSCHVLGPVGVRRPDRKYGGSRGQGRKLRCPFCSFRAKRDCGIRIHVGIHFDFNGFLQMRGLEVKYERCWSETDTITIRSSNREEEMVIDRDDNTDNLRVFYKETDESIERKK